MTNSDRLQEIRERAEKPHDYFWTTEAGNAAVDDRHYLLQLVTKQENEIAWLRTWIFRLDSNFESVAKKIMASNTEEPMTIEQVKEFLGIDPGSASGTPGTAD